MLPWAKVIAKYIDNDNDILGAFVVIGLYLSCIVATCGGPALLIALVLIGLSPSSNVSKKDSSHHNDVEGNRAETGTGNDITRATISTTRSKMT